MRFDLSTRVLDYSMRPTERVRLTWDAPKRRWPWPLTFTVAGAGACFVLGVGIAQIVF